MERPMHLTLKRYEDLRGYEARYHQLNTYVTAVLDCDVRCQCTKCEAAEKELESHRDE